MNENGKIDEEPKQVPTGHSEPIDKKEVGGAFSNVHRQLTTEELNNPIVQKWLVNEVDKLQNVQKELVDLTAKYHELNKENAVLLSEKNSSLVMEIMSCLMFAIGPALIGLTPSITQVRGNEVCTYYMTWIILGIGVLILIVAVFAKFIALKK